MQSEETIKKALHRLKMVQKNYHPEKTGKAKGLDFSAEIRTLEWVLLDDDYLMEEIEE